MESTAQRMWSMILQLRMVTEGDYTYRAER